jgi:hypothetical protein
MIVTILSFEYNDSGWFVTATVEDEHGTRRGSHQLDLPESAGPDDFVRAIQALYA